MAADTIVPFGSIRRYAAHELARRILENGPRECFIGGALGVNLAATRCALCGGSFPQIGRATFVLDHAGSVRYMHKGCATTDVEAWAHGPDCEDGCERCLGEPV